MKFEVSCSITGQLVLEVENETNNLDEISVTVDKMFQEEMAKINNKNLTINTEYTIDEVREIKRLIVYCVYKTDICGRGNKKFMGVFLSEENAQAFIEKNKKNHNYESWEYVGVETKDEFSCNCQSPIEEPEDKPILPEDEPVDLD